MVWKKGALNMGCCGGHFQMHDERDKRASQQDTPHHDHAGPYAPAGPEGGSLRRWIAPLVLGLGVALVYFIISR